MHAFVDEGTVRGILGVAAAADPSALDQARRTRRTPGNEHALEEYGITAPAGHRSRSSAYSGAIDMNGSSRPEEMVDGMGSRLLQIVTDRDG